MFKFDNKNTEASDDPVVFGTSIEDQAIALEMATSYALKIDEALDVLEEMSDDEKRSVVFEYLHTGNNYLDMQIESLALEEDYDVVTEGLKDLGSEMLRLASNLADSVESSLKDNLKLADSYEKNLRETVSRYKGRAKESTKDEVQVVHNRNQRIWPVVNHEIRPFEVLDREMELLEYIQKEYTGNILSDLENFNKVFSSAGNLVEADFEFDRDFKDRKQPAAYFDEKFMEKDMIFLNNSVVTAKRSLTTRSTNNDLDANVYINIGSPTVSNVLIRVTKGLEPVVLKKSDIDDLLKRARKFMDMYYKSHELRRSFSSILTEHATVLGNINKAVKRSEDKVKKADYKRALRYSAVLIACFQKIVITSIFKSLDASRAAQKMAHLAIKQL